MKSVVSAYFSLRSVIWSKGRSYLHHHSVKLAFEELYQSETGKRYLRKQLRGMNLYFSHRYLSHLHQLHLVKSSNARPMQV
ncbi:hypothetical protein HanXRQr2_Chr12g0546721 [Helianthus annuus]|uniref:Uncharacterized protein n=1 Tax=Helianthus annuus TaxID=4232 RepID=A0A9K3HHI2_HELAN|nr:hypothetical protein HanXRQr2_Chr12g0546721 [Helianthus annuus]KAJ0863125.1 hypothetical protein HanPSC8_Chr12g0526261 [Helianthus annuus]